MSAARILLIDASVVSRRATARVLEEFSDMEVRGAANDGASALRRAAGIEADVALVDTELADDATAVIRSLREQFPKLVIILYSRTVRRGSPLAVQAIERGATAWVQRPDDGEDEVVRTRLVPLIRQHLSMPQPAPEPIVPAPTSARSLRPQVVLIGCSTGGPTALQTVLSQLPGDFPVPILIVQHLPQNFDRRLVQSLSSHTRLTMRLAESGAQPTAGEVWLAPADTHLVVARRGALPSLHFDHGPPQHSCRPAVDPLFVSAARVYGAAALGVILTGMGQDGLEGCRLLKQTGAPIIAQDEASSVVWGMPGFVAQAGLADAVLPLSQIAMAIVERVSRRARVGRELATAGPEAPTARV